MRVLIALVLIPSLGGCVARTAMQVVSLPVKVASAGVDAAITTQAEADEKRGRQIREREECLGKEARKADRQNREPDYTRCDPPAEAAAPEKR
jgi:hypothetical protein